MNKMHRNDEEISGLNIISNDEDYDDFSTNMNRSDNFINYDNGCNDENINIDGDKGHISDEKKYGMDKFALNEIMDGDERTSEINFENGNFDNRSNESRDKNFGDEKIEETSKLEDIRKYNEFCKMFLARP